MPLTRLASLRSLGTLSPLCGERENTAREAPASRHLNLSPTTRTSPSGTGTKPSSFVVCAISTLR
jgi:hypothetical protein